MNNLSHKINLIDDLIHYIQKIESKLRVGHIPDAWREINGIIAHIQKQEIIESTKDILLRQLQKIASKINMGQIVPAWREINQIISFLRKIKKDMIEKLEKPDTSSSK